MGKTVLRNVGLGIVFGTCTAGISKLFPAEGELVNMSINNSKLISSFFGAIDDGLVYITYNQYWG